MAKVVTDDNHYKSIADTIRNHGIGGNDRKINPAEMSAKIGQVAFEQYVEGERQGYSSGVQEGYDDGFTVGEESGIAEGKQSEYDRMWDMLQQNGTRNAYPYAFIDWGWEYIRPKYKIVPVTDQIAYMFGHNVDLVKVEAEYVDLSQRTSNSDETAASGNYCVFINCAKLEEIEDIGMPAGYYYRTFRKCYKLHTIAVVRFNSATQIYGAFDNCDSLVNLTVEGTIGQSGLDLQWSTKLSKTSITSVINALSASASGKSVTLSKTAVNAAFTDAEWPALVGTKTNWTINLM